jgi:hypothetical protein
MTWFVIHFAFTITACRPPVVHGPMRIGYFSTDLCFVAVDKPSFVRPLLIA